MAEVLAPRSRRTENVPRPTTSLPRSLMSRLSTGHLVMIVAGLLGLLLTVAVLRRADERQPVAVAARDLAPGSALTESSVRYEQVKMDDSLLDSVLQPNDVKRLRDSVAAYPIAAGELVNRRAVRPAAAPAGKRAMSVAIDPARAVNGELEAGDRVDVILAGNHEVSIIVADAEVLSVGRPDRARGVRRGGRQVHGDARRRRARIAARRGWDCRRRHRDHEDDRFAPGGGDAPLPIDASAGASGR